STTEDDELEIDFESETEVEEERKWVDVSEFEKMKEQFEKEKKDAVNEAVGKVKAEYSQIEKEVETLRKFKEDKEVEDRRAKENELFESFSNILSDEDVSELKEKSSDYSLEELETQLYVLVGKKKSNFSKQTKKNKKSTVKLGVDNHEDN